MTIDILPILAQLTEYDRASGVLFYLFALVTAGAAIGVVISQNIVRTAVSLLFTLGGVAGLYFLLYAEFVAALQLIIYAGGTLILILFGVMLTSKSPFVRFQASMVEVVIAISVASVLLIALVMAIHHTTFASQPIDTGFYPVGLLGQALLGDYLVPFEMASVVLLVVMIGAAYLAKARRRPDERGPQPPAGSQEASRRAREWS